MRRALVESAAAGADLADKQFAAGNISELARDGERAAHERLVSGSSTAYPYGTALYTQPGWNSNVGYLRGGPSSPLNYTTGTRDPAGNYYNSAGQQTFNNAAAAQQYYNTLPSGGDDLQFIDRLSGVGIRFRRTSGAP